MSTPDALVFDLDGTLWDAAVPTASGWNAALAELGAKTRVTVEGIRSVAGTPFHGCVEILVPELRPPSEAAISMIDDREKAAITESGGTLFPGVGQGLRRLASAYPLYLVSNCQDWYLELFMRESGVGECFSGGDCNGLSGLSKADMLLRLARERRLETAVYVGDTQGDYESATAAGMPFVFARYGFGNVPARVLAFDSFEGLVEHFLAMREDVAAGRAGGEAHP